MTAVLLAVVMIVMVIPFATISVSAGSVIESAISWAVNIANDDSHGYSQTSRWGPDYDCSSLVITAFNNAGISTGNATYTGNMISNFEANGFIWVPWSSIGNSSNLQRGDILLNISYHTAIYMGNNQVVEAHARSAADKSYDSRPVSQATTLQGDQDGQEIRVTNYYWYSSGGWDGVLRYKDEPVNPPTNVWLGKNQVWYDIQDTINLAPHADGADYYWFSVYKDGQQIISQAIYGEYCFSANQWGYGDYSAYITAANSVGGTDSEWVDFSVVGVPSYNSIYKSSYWYDITDTVSITVESVCAKGQVIGIDKEGVGRVVTESCDATFSIAASQLGVGDYSAYFSIYNGSGGIDTERIAFSIVGSPSYSDVYASKTIYKTDETVAITVDTVCAKGQVIGIDKEGVGRVVTENCDSTYYISASQLGVGKYSCYFSVYNGSGSIDTKRAFFEIVDEYSSANLGNDFYAYIKNVDSDKVLKNNNGNVELSAKSNNSNQIWRFIRNSDNTYTMLSFFDNKAMDVAGAESENGTNIQTYESNGSNAQHWYIIECKNGYIFIPKSSQNKVADLLYGHTEAGTNLQLYDYNGSSAQIFTVEKAAPINALISLNKKSYNINDTITINVSADCGVDYYQTQIWENDRIAYQKDFTGHSLSIPCNELGIGNYAVYVSCVNDFGNTITETISFSVIDYSIGDTNLDGKITIRDVTAIQRHLAELEVFTDDQLALADTNGDGKVDISDATHLQKYLAEFDGIILEKQS